MSSKEKLLQRYRGKCAYCGADLKASTVTVDHVFPKSKGGIRSKANTKPSCKFCNMLKSDLSIKEFRKKLKAFINMDDEKGKKARNKYRLRNGKVVFFYEDLYRQISEEIEYKRVVWETINKETDCEKLQETHNTSK